MSVTLLLQIEGFNRILVTQDSSITIKELKTNAFAGIRNRLMPDHYKTYIRGRLIEDETKSLQSVIQEKFQIVEFRFEVPEKEVMAIAQTKTIRELEAIQVQLSQYIAYRKSSVEDVEPSTNVDDVPLTGSPPLDNGVRNTIIGKEEPVPEETTIREKKVETASPVTIDVASVVKVNPKVPKKKTRVPKKKKAVSENESPVTPNNGRAETPSP